jgi:uncharacterized membrane-anchored protein YitT (DUF2179 family)
MCVYFQRLISKYTPQMRRDLPMSKVFLRISFALGGAYFALGGVCFLQLHALADENSTGIAIDRQCCQGVEI